MKLTLAIDPVDRTVSLREACYLAVGDVYDLRLEFPGPSPESATVLLRRGGPSGRAVSSVRAVRADGHRRLMLAEWRLSSSELDGWRRALMEPEEDGSYDDGSNDRFDVEAWLEVYDSRTVHVSCAVPLRLRDASGAGPCPSDPSAAPVPRRVAPFLLSVSLPSADLPASKAWLDSRGWTPSGASACSVHVRSASSVRRWFDWRRDEASEIACHVPGGYDPAHPFAVAGMSSMGMLCPDGSGMPPDLVRFVPHMMVDGVNAAGVFAAVNVVAAGAPDAGWAGSRCPSAAAVYECLSRFGAAAEAAAWIAEAVYVPPKFSAATGCSVHFMLADASGAVWTVEDGVAREVSGSGDDVPCMSNFRLYGGGGVRSAGTAAAVAPYDPLGSGVERYALLKSGSYAVRDIFFTGAYASASARPSEFTGLARADGTPVTLANLSEQASADAVAGAVAGYDPDDDSGTWWHTAHFAEYDLESRTFSVRVREGSQSWSFGLFEQAAEGVEGGGGGGEQVQADWSEADAESPAFIRNRPDLSLKLDRAGGTVTGDLTAASLHVAGSADAYLTFGGSVRAPLLRRASDGHYLSPDGRFEVFLTPAAPAGTVVGLVVGGEPPPLTAAVGMEGFPYSGTFPGGASFRVDGAAVPVATADDLEGKVDKEAGKGLSSNDYTSAEKSKLAGKLDRQYGTTLSSLGIAVDDDGTAVSFGAHSVVSGQPRFAVHAAFASPGDGSRPKYVTGPAEAEAKGFAFMDDLPYTLSPEVGTRKVMVITATGPQSVTLPEIPETGEVMNCDIWVNAEGAGADVGLTVYSDDPSTVPVRFPDGEAITCKKGCVTLVTCVGIDGQGWCVAACNTFAVPAQTVGT